VSEIDTSAWDGRPENPEKRGWHWIGGDAWEWIPDSQTWLGGCAELSPSEVAATFARYLGPCVLPADLAALRERLRLAEEVADAAGALEQTFGEIPGPGPEDEDLFIHERAEEDLLRRKLAAWRAAQQGSAADGSR
jgi:hypothetical protein